MVTNPRGGPEATRCATRLMGILAKGVQVRVAEIADYELRRELLRAGSAQGLSRLDQLKETLGYLPITTDAMLMADPTIIATTNVGHLNPTLRGAPLDRNPVRLVRRMPTDVDWPSHLSGEVLQAAAGVAKTVPAAGPRLSARPGPPQQFRNSVPL